MFVRLIQGSGLWKKILQISSLERLPW